MALMVAVPMVTGSQGEVRKGMELWVGQGRAMEVAFWVLVLMVKVFWVRVIIMTAS